MLASIQQLKNDLSRYLERVLHGEELLIARYNVPIARLIPLAPFRRKAKTMFGRSQHLGRIKGKVTGPFLKASEWTMLRKKPS